MPVLYTIGYEGRDLGEMIALLQAKKIARLIDIRELPLSRRRGFSKTPLGVALGAAGIEYLHMREAGNPFRKIKDSIDRGSLLTMYRGHLKEAPDVITHVADAARDQRTVLLCYEADVGTCHRSVLAPRVAKKLGASVTDL